MSIEPLAVKIAIGPIDSKLIAGNVRRVAEVAAMTLTPAQIAVISLVAKGRFNKEIAYLLGVEEATVKAHLSQAMKRLHLRNR